MLHTFFTSASRFKVFGVFTTLSRGCGVREMSNLTGLNTQAVQQVFNCFKNNLAVSNKKHKLKLEPSFKKSLTKVFQFLASEERALRAVSEQQKFEECLALTDSARQLHYALRTKPN